MTTTQVSGGQVSERRSAPCTPATPDEVESATKAGRGEPLAMGRGRVMKGWLVVNATPRWYAAAERARAFVAGGAASAAARTRARKTPK